MIYGLDERAPQGGTISAFLIASLLAFVGTLPGCVVPSEDLDACADDRAEPDDDMATATVLEEGTIDRVACPGSPDVYIFPGSSSDEFGADEETVVLIFETGMQLTVERFDPDGQSMDVETRDELGSVRANGCYRFQAGGMTVSAVSERTPYMVRYYSWSEWCGE